MPACVLLIILSKKASSKLSLNCRRASSLTQPASTGRDLSPKVSKAVFRASAQNCGAVFAWCRWSSAGVAGVGSWACAAGVGCWASSSLANWPRNLASPCPVLTGPLFICHAPSSSFSSTWMSTSAIVSDLSGSYLTCFASRLARLRAEASTCSRAACSRRAWKVRDTEHPASAASSSASTHPATSCSPFCMPRRVFSSITSTDAWKHARHSPPSRSGTQPARSAAASPA
mmetsp:Transcript_113027/g.298557  ORF Transcript_113027/g.298557 Transcript_113027/m.298557 type:complete len:230 (+) Transcript_113027:1347-2036(+)